MNGLTEQGISTCSLQIFGPQLFGLVVVGLDPIHFNSKDAGSVLLRNVIIHLQDYVISQLRRPQSEHSPQKSKCFFSIS